MLTIHTKEEMLFDEKNEVFFTVVPRVVDLEHSLISVSRWESIWEKPFIDAEFGPNKSPDKTNKELKSYISCMCLKTQPNDVLSVLWSRHRKEIFDYIGARMHATNIYYTPTKGGGSSKKRTKPVTSDQIYSWMVRYNIPFQAEKWHLNRLLILLELRSLEENPNKKLSPKETRQYQRALNDKRRAELGL